MKRIAGLVAAVLVLGGCCAETWVNNAGWTCDGVSCRVPPTIADDQVPVERVQ